MIYNLYSSLSLPMSKKIKPTSVLANKLTTMVFNRQQEYSYVHLYEDKGKHFEYLKTIKLEGISF